MFFKKVTCILYFKKTLKPYFFKHSISLFLKQKYKVVIVILELNSENFESVVVDSDKPVIIDFWAEWCGPCKIVGPIFEELSTDMTNIKFCKINVDNNQDLAGKFAVKSIPTLIVFKNGEEVDRIVGALGKDDLQQKIKEIIS